jgi:spore maturation protein CgeB
MRLLFLTTLYPAYLRQIYDRTPGLDRRPFAEQREAIDRDCFGWVGVWPRALAPLGYQVEETYLDAEVSQRAWQREHGGPVGGNLADIAVAQARAFAPEVLWYDHDDDALLARLREEVSSIRRVLGWVGSWFPAGRSWRGTDLVLSCAPESVEELRRREVRSEVLAHGFDPRVLDVLAPAAARYPVTFVGQITLGHPLHVHRVRLLEALRGQVDVTVFSPAAERASWEGPRARARQALYAGARAAQRLGVPAHLLGRLPALRHAATWSTPPRGPLPAALQRALRPGRFGLEMFQTLRDSLVTLNIHAGSTTPHSSNMRLFEATGVGACLLTDWTEGLGELFEPEREVATYRSPGECLERIRWLLDHPADREAIARAGQARTLREHGYRHRAERLDGLIREVLAERSEVRA